MFIKQRLLLVSERALPNATSLTWARAGEHLYDPVSELVFVAKTAKIDDVHHLFIDFVGALRRRQTHVDAFYYIFCRLVLGQPEAFAPIVENGYALI